MNVSSIGKTASTPPHSGVHNEVVLAEDLVPRLRALNLEPEQVVRLAYEHSSKLVFITYVSRYSAAIEAGMIPDYPDAITSTLRLRSTVLFGSVSQSGLYDLQLGQIADAFSRHFYDTHRVTQFVFAAPPQATRQSLYSKARKEVRPLGNSSILGRVSMRHDPVNDLLLAIRLGRAETNDSKLCIFESPLERDLEDLFRDNAWLPVDWTPEQELVSLSALVSRKDLIRFVTNHAGDTHHVFQLIASPKGFAATAHDVFTAPYVVTRPIAGDHSLVLACSMNPSAVHQRMKIHALDRATQPSLSKYSI